jgi:hypothetical protein
MELFYVAANQHNTNTVALGSTQPATEMGTRVISFG